MTHKIPHTPENILRLLSELEGSSQLLQYLNFLEDQKIIDEIKQKYYKMYFSLKKLT